MNKKDVSIKTDRLTLRLVQKKDALRAFNILTKDPQITDHLTFLPPKNVSETEGYFEFAYNSDSMFEFGIWFDDQFIGMIGFNGLVYTSPLKKRIHNSANFGYWLSPKFHGQGIMTEAAKAVLAFGFDELKLHRIHAKHIAVNIASEKVLKKCGFKYIGLERQAAFYDNTWWDEKLYDLLKEDLK